MNRLIEVQDADAVSPTLTLQIGDALWFSASGGRVCESDGEIFEESKDVELLGIFLQSVIGNDGRIISPIGSPNAVLFLARRAGQANIEVMTGDPWSQSRTVTLSVIVEG